jgi:xanthine dehydrogenase small subunit
MILRMTRVEAMLAGEPPTLALFQRAAEVAAVDVTPITDVRGSESYRRALAGNILLKFWHDEFAAESTGGNNRGGNGSPAPPSPIRSVAPAGSAPLVARSPEAGR